MKRILALLLFSSLFIATTIGFLKNQYFYHDDSFISLKYARNLAKGSGLVWNKGEFVQGYTNFLLVVILAFFSYLKINLIFASKLIGIASYLIIITLSYFIFKPYKKIIHLIPLALIISAYPLIVWSLSGMETVLFALLIFISTSLTIKFLNKENKKLSLLNGFIHALSFLLRPEGILIFVVTSFFMLLNKKIKNLILFLISFSLIILPYIAWQFYYYGTIIPNSVLAKTYGIPKSNIFKGFEYFFSFSLTPSFLILFLSLNFLFLKKKKFEQSFFYLICVILSYFALIIYVGGDHMPSYRFFAPLIPLLSYLLALTLKKIELNKNLEVLFIFIVSISMLAQIYTKKLNPIKPDAPVELGSLIAKHIKGKWKDNTLIALNPAGTIPFLRPEYKYIDMLGLNDKVIAKTLVKEITLSWQKLPGHAKGNGKYVLDREPDIIISGPVNGSDPRIKPWWKSDLEIAKDSRFIENYIKETDFIKKTDNIFLKFTYFKRKNNSSKKSS